MGRHADKKVQSGPTEEAKKSKAGQGQGRRRRDHRQQANKSGTGSQNKQALMQADGSKAPTQDPDNSKARARELGGGREVNCSTKMGEGVPTTPHHMRESKRTRRQPLAKALTLTPKQHTRLRA